MAIVLGSGSAGAAGTATYKRAELVRVKIIRASDQGSLLYADWWRMAKWLAVFRVTGEDGEEKLLKIAMHSPVRMLGGTYGLRGKKYDLKIEPGGDDAAPNEIRLTVTRLSEPPDEKKIGQ